MTETTDKGDHEDHEENLIEEENKATHRIVKNRLFLTSILNAIVFLVFVFSMTYYNWGRVGVPLLQTAEEVRSHTPEKMASFHFNLLYAKTDNDPLYQSFTTVSSQICVTGDYFCLQTMYSLRFVGFLCFFVLFIGAAFQIYDIYRMALYLTSSMREEDHKQFSESKQDNLRHIISIGLFLVGLTLNIFGMA